MIKKNTRILVTLLIFGGLVSPWTSQGAELGSAQSVSDLSKNETKTSAPELRTLSVGYEADYDDPASLQHKVSVGQSLGSADLSLGVTVEGDQNPRSWKGVQLADPFLQLNAKARALAGGLRLGGDLRAYFPASAKSQEKKLLFGIRSTQLASYSLGGPWRLGLKSMLRWNRYGESSNFSSKKNSAGPADLSSFVRPVIAYQASHDVEFVLRYEMCFAHRKGNALMDLDSDGFALQPGVSWDLQPNLNLYPFFVIKTAGPTANTDPIYLAAELTWNVI